MQKQKMTMTYACLDTDLENGYPPTLYSGEAIRNDAICEVMNVATREIYKMFKMSDGLWFEYIVGETGYAQTRFQEWNGYPDSPVESAVYPHQIIVSSEGVTRLYASKQSIVYNWGNPGCLDTHPQTDETVRGWFLSEGAWITGFDTNLNIPYPGAIVLKTSRDIININSGTLLIARNM